MVVRGRSLTAQHFSISGKKMNREVWYGPNLGEQLVELLERALVELQRRARQHDPRGPRACRRRPPRARSVDERLIVSPVSSRRRPDGQRAPLILVERAAGRSPGRSAAGRRGAARCGRARRSRSRAACERGSSTTPEWSAELHGEIAGARDALAEPLQDACAQRMSQGLRDPCLRGLPRWSGPGLPDGVA